MRSKMSPWGKIIESMFQVINKAGTVVPFKLNWAQRRLDSMLTGRDIIPKARQLGMSTYFLARFTAKCMTLSNRRCVIISHEEEATKRLLQRVQFFITHLKLNVEIEHTEIVVETERKSRAEIVFKDTGSWFFIGTAGSGAFGRGDTITDLHCSEFAHWPHPHELATGLFGSVPDIDQGGEIFIESTGNGIANDFAKRVYESNAGKSHWMVHFFPWHEEPAYTVELSKRRTTELLANLRDDIDETEIKVAFKLTAGQLEWRRRRLSDMGGSLTSFHQEYPMTIDECFQATGATIFDRVLYKPTLDWKETIGRSTGYGRLAGHPKSNLTYVMGVDSSGGKGLDNAVIQISCIETDEQVECWWSNATPPDSLARVVHQKSDEYNGAYTVIEANNHGLVVLNELRHRKFPGSRLYRFRSPDNKPKDNKKQEAALMDLGYQTTGKTKPLAVGRLRARLAEGWVIHDPGTFMELQAFIETPDGKFQAQEGAHDDKVMALVMLSVGLRQGTIISNSKKPKTPEQHVDPFSLEGILTRITDNKIEQGISTQGEALYEDYDFF